MRLQVFLSHNGVASRRKAFEIIQQGQVKVNGAVVTEPSFQVDEHKDKILVENKLVEAKKFDYILLNKSAGFVATKAEFKNEKNIYDLLPEKYHHLIPVGRLDKDTEGLLLLTNDGDLAYKLTHPKFNIDKIYQVRVTGELNAAQKNQLENGVVIEGKKTSPAKIKDIKAIKDQTEFLMSIHEGRKRQIRLMCEAVGHKVIYLKRVAQGSLELGNLKTGEFRNLTQQEIEKLKQL